MGSCAAPSAKGDDKFITTDYLQQCQHTPDDSSIILGCNFMAAFTSTRRPDRRIAAAGNALKYKICGWPHSFRDSAGEYREAGPY
ncbi:hypothetical protein DB361_14860 [Klebsiella pneumoniae]|nr:hypothetical protein DB361_14860 [Klebsiella pneumoniae]